MTDKNIKKLRERVSISLSAGLALSAGLDVGDLREFMLGRRILSDKQLTALAFRLNIMDAK